MSAVSSEDLQPVVAAVGDEHAALDGQQEAWTVQTAVRAAPRAEARDRVQARAVVSLRRRLAGLARLRGRRAVAAAAERGEDAQGRRDEEDGDARTHDGRHDRILGHDAPGAHLATRRARAVGTVLAVTADKIPGLNSVLADTLLPSL